MNIAAYIFSNLDGSIPHGLSESIHSLLSALIPSIASYFDICLIDCFTIINAVMNKTMMPSLDLT
ncbi:MAG TPA: hypothetical protein VF233_11345, partial [Nitrososphaeraceae archaeon]